MTADSSMANISAPVASKSTSKPQHSCDAATELSSLTAHHGSAPPYLKHINEQIRGSSDPRAPRFAHMGSKPSDSKDHLSDSFASLVELGSTYNNNNGTQTLKASDHIPSFKHLWSTPVLPKPSSPVSTRMEELLHDCFAAAIDKDLISPEKASVVLEFHKYLHEIHCHENLAFIIEIYKYEYFYEKIHGAGNERHKVNGLRHLNSDFLNLLLESYIDNMPFPTPNMRKVVRRNSLRSRSSQSLCSPDPFPLDFDEPPSGVHEVWDDFCDRNISSDSDDDWPLDMGPTISTESFNEGLLAEQWDYIMSNFIEHNSPSQINLCDRTVDLLVKNSSVEEQAHNPLLLQKAKSEVVLILRENAFDSFIRKINLGESNLFDKLYCSSVPVLALASPVCMPASHASSASSDREPKNTMTYTSTSNKNRIVSPRSADTLLKLSATPLEPTVVAPVPSKRRPKFFSAFANSSSSEGLSSPSGSFTGLFKTPALSGHGRLTYSAPQSPSPSSMRSRAVTPSSLLDIGESLGRPGSGGSDNPQSPSILGKLWRKKK